MEAQTALSNGSNPNGLHPVEPEALENDDDLDLGEAHSLYERFMSLVPKVEAEVQRLDQEKDRLQREYRRQVERVNFEQKRLLGLLKELGASPSAKTARPRPGSKPSVSNDRLLRVMDAIEAEAEVNELFTALDVANRGNFTWSEASTYQAFAMLRDAEFIGKAGKTGTKQPRDLYRILDRKAGERLRASLSHQVERRNQKISAHNLERVVGAIKELNKPHLVAQDISDFLGLTSPKQVYPVLHHLVESGFLAQEGFDTPQGGSTGRGRVIFAVNEQRPVEEALNG